MSATEEPVTVVVTRRIKPGHEAEYEAWVKDVAAATSRFAGHRGLTLHRPHKARDPWVLVYAFDTGAHLDAWMSSDVRQEFLAKAAAFAEGGHTHAAFTGMEPFFALPPTASTAAPSPPPRWKMAVTTGAAVWPLAQALGWAAGGALPGVSPLLRSALVTAALVALLTWVVMPRLTRVLAPWLFGRPTTS